MTEKKARIIKKSASDGNLYQTNENSDGTGKTDIMRRHFEGAKPKDSGDPSQDSSRDQEKSWQQINDDVDQAVDKVLQQQLDDTPQEEAQGTNKQALNTLRQFEAKVRDCDTINNIVSQLEKSSNTTEVDALRQEHNRALLEAIQAGDKGPADKMPAFEVLEQKLDQNMQNRCDSCLSQITDMGSLYDNCLRTSGNDPRPSDIRRDDDDYVNATIGLSNLEGRCNEFNKQRTNAQEGKFGGERIESSRTLMRTLSDIEKSTQELEMKSEQLIGLRFRRSQSRAKVAKHWQDVHPDVSLVEEYQRACEYFKQMRTNIETKSGGARTKGCLELGETLLSIESLEDQIRDSGR